MAQRKTILANDQIYHLFNRGVEKRPIFISKNGYRRFINLADYYRFANCPGKFSRFKTLSREIRQNILQELRLKSDKLVDILAFCLMPNHIHFLCKQIKDNGIAKFMNKLCSGYSHHFNILNERVGPLFQGNFKAVRIVSEEQLIHVSRYIHLNPVSSYLIAFKQLENYEFSSYPEYLGNNSGFCNTHEVLSYFKNIQDYKNFVADQVEYAKELENIKHLVFD